MIRMGVSLRRHLPCRARHPPRDGSLRANGRVPPLERDRSAREPTSDAG